MINESANDELGNLAPPGPLAVDRAVAIMFVNGQCSASAVRDAILLALGLEVAERFQP